MWVIFNFFPPKMSVSQWDVEQELVQSAGTPVELEEMRMHMAQMLAETTKQQELVAQIAEELTSLWSLLSPGSRARSRRAFASDASAADALCAALYTYGLQGRSILDATEARLSSSLNTAMAPTKAATTQRDQEAMQPPAASSLTSKSEPTSAHGQAPSLDGKKTAADDDRHQATSDGP